jgi:carotenoid cleavage dioxygenase-like enzyme
MNAALIDKPSLARGRLRGFQSVDVECTPTDLPVRGNLPGWLAGTYLLNGPAQWELPKRSYRHWFDGLALLHSFRIRDGRVRYQSRFLQSQDWRESHAKGRPELGGFDTPVAGGLLSRLIHLLNPRRSDNGCVVMSQCDGQWLALTESDRALRFDVESLATEGELAWTDRSKQPLMAAHPCIDGTGRWWNVGAILGPTCQYVLFTCDRTGRRDVKARIPVKRTGYLHAFAMTATRAVIWECAWRAHPLRFLLAGESYARHFDWLPAGGSRLHTVRLSDGAVRSWDAPPLMLFHAAQTFDIGDDVALDLCLQDIAVVDELQIDRLRAGFSTKGPVARHVRFVLSPGTSSAREEPLPGRFELPQVNAAAAAKGAVRYVWGATTAHDTPGAFFNRTIQVDLQDGEVRLAGSNDAVALEPHFVPNPRGETESDGVLLVHTLADNDPGSRIRVLDAGSLDERAVIELPHVIPFGFHGAWMAATR